MTIYDIMIEKLDKIDRKIIRELDINSRKTNSAISKTIRLSKKGTEYRINQLIKKDIISGFYPVIDFFKLGYQYNRVFLKIQHESDELKKEIENYIHNVQSINWAAWFKGEYDLAMTFWTETDSEFKELLMKFIIKFNINIREKYIAKAIKLDHYLYPMTNEKIIYKTTIKETNNILEIDDMDYNILLELNKDARQNSTRIARKLKSNYKVISYRIKKLTKQGILLTSRPKINHEKLGLIHNKVYLYLKYKNEESPNLLKQYIKNLPGLIYIVETIGTEDMDFEIITESEDEFFNLMNTIQNKFPDMISHMKFITFRNTIKISYLPNR
jgi:Lrp/AsnC family transcriptional regulator